MSQWDFGLPPPEHHEFRPPDLPGYETLRGPAEPTAPHPAQFDEPDGEYDGGVYPITYERPVTYERPPAYGSGGSGSGSGGFRQDVYPPDTDEWGSYDPPRLPPRTHRSRRPYRPHRPRWLLTSAIALAAGTVGATLVLAGGGGHAAQPRPAGNSHSAAATRSPGASAPAAGELQPSIGIGQARQVLAHYTSVNNAANARMSAALLGTIETGSSYTIDAGSYRMELAGKATAAYSPFGPKTAKFYIPRQSPGAYPRWFAVRVSNAEMAHPNRVTAIEYLLFTQAGPGGPWRNAIEPVVLKGGMTLRIATDAAGYATAVGAASSSTADPSTAGPSTAGLSVAPTGAAAVTAASLDGHGPVANPGNLSDLHDQAFWRGRLSATGTDSVRHATAPGAVLGLRTADGGALLFYTVSAELTLAPPPGQTMRLTIAGFYSGEKLTRASVGYLEQFASYDPPRSGAGGTGLRIVADYSGITSRS
jgi:hypothetical protein